jgi:hypothetical protein
MVIIQKVLDHNKLAFSRASDAIVVCDPCRCVKSHQLPFPRSLSVSKAPLELIFWMCGGLPQVLLEKIVTM